VSRIQTILLPVGADLYAVPIESVREILAAPAVAQLVTAPASVLGLVNVRGEIVPLLDTAALLGVGTVGNAPFAAVLHTAHGPAALASTGFPQRAELGPPTGSSELPGTAGTYGLGQRVAVMLDPAVLLGIERAGESDVHPGPATAELH